MTERRKPSNDGLERIWDLLKSALLRGQVPLLAGHWESAAGVLVSNLFPEPPPGSFRGPGGNAEIMSIAQVVVQSPEKVETSSTELLSSEVWSPSLAVNRPLRLRLSPSIGKGARGGAWWPYSRDLSAEALDLVDPISRRRSTGFAASCTPPPIGTRPHVGSRRPTFS
jgi:Family of unknown function (DUF5994)